ncbi:MAG TPA: hypothetical protein VGK31_05095 [Thermoanaerobaculia bacterium]|jgi:hypothetical protein
MNSLLATEPIVATEEKRITLPPLESWVSNEAMRHVPSLDWMVKKVDVDLRQRIAKLTAPFANLASADPRYAGIEKELRALGKAIDRLTDSAKPVRHNGNGGDLPSRIQNALTQALGNLRSLELTPFGRRHPFHCFDRSKAEIVYGALLAVLYRVERLVPIIREVDPSIDEQLLAES